MMGRFFITEFSRIVNNARAHIETSEVPEEQLYLVIISIVNYLRSRPEILATMDWIKTRRLDVGKTVSDRLFRIIGSVKLEAIRKHDKNFLVWMAQWIIFMVVNTLAWWPSKEGDSPPAGPDNSGAWVKNVAEIPNESFRTLFRFMALGLEEKNT